MYILWMLIGRRKSAEEGGCVRNEAMRRKTRKGMLTFRLVGGRRVQIREHGVVDVLGVWIFRASGLGWYSI